MCRPFNTQVLQHTLLNTDCVTQDDHLVHRQNCGECTEIAVKKNSLWNAFSLKSNTSTNGINNLLLSSPKKNAKMFFFSFLHLLLYVLRGTLPATLRRRQSLNIDHTSAVLLLTGQTDSDVAIFGLLYHISSRELFFFFLFRATAFLTARRRNVSAAE